MVAVITVSIPRRHHLRHRHDHELKQHNLTTRLFLAVKAISAIVPFDVAGTSGML